MFTLVILKVSNLVFHLIEKSKYITNKEDPVFANNKVSY